MLLGHHGLGHLSGAVERSSEVYPHDAVPFFVCQLPDGLADVVGDRAGVVQQNVNLAELVQAGLHQVGYLR